MNKCACVHIYGDRRVIDQGVAQNVSAYRKKAKFARLYDIYTYIYICICVRIYISIKTGE